MLLQKNTKKQADVSLGIAIAYFTSLGYSVSVPLTESQRYDLVVDDGEQLNRIEVKSTRYARRGCYEVVLATFGGNKTASNIKRDLSSHDADYVFIYADDGSRYLIPTVEIEGRAMLRLGAKWSEYLV